MGNAAASGGYYVSAYAKHIMAQTGTITGSIGVISGRISTKGLLQKLQVNQEEIFGELMNVNFVITYQRVCLDMMTVISIIMLHLQWSVKNVVNLLYLKVEMSSKYKQSILKVIKFKSE